MENILTASDIMKESLKNMKEMAKGLSFIMMEEYIKASGTQIIFTD